MDGIFHVCRAFEDPDVTHVEDRIDPVSDLDIIHSELRAKDIERMGGIIESFSKLRGALQKEQKEELECANKVGAADSEARQCCRQGGGLLFRLCMLSC